MSYQVKHLMQKLARPIVAAPNELIKDVLARMIENDFSQLPVVDPRSNQFYLITTDSIIKAFVNFGVKVRDTQLTVSAAMFKVNRSYKADDDLFEILRDVRDNGAALIIDDVGSLLHIVTSYDTTEYFRRTSEDTMLVRDVENSLKKYITVSFRKPDNSTNETARQKVTDEIASSNRIKEKQFAQGVQHYLQLIGNNFKEIDEKIIDLAFGEFLKNSSLNKSIPRNQNIATSTAEALDTKLASEQVIDEPLSSEENNTTVYDISQMLRQRFRAAIELCLADMANKLKILNANWSVEAFSKINSREKPLDFMKDLTFNDYIQIFLHNSCFSQLELIFSQNREEISNMLNGVRETRNKLAHFREEEITVLERHQLKNCTEWLDTHWHKVDEIFEVVSEPESDENNIL